MTAGMMRLRALVAALWLGTGLIFSGAALAGQEDVSLRHGDIVLNGRLVTANGGDLAGGLVLIVHGTLAHHRMELIDAMQTALQDRGVDSLAITLGFGIDDRSGMYDCAAPHRHRHLDALDEIAAWLDWLAQRGAANVTLMGHSRGGNQAARFAAERGHDVLARLVLLAPATWDKEGRFADYLARFGAPLALEIERAAVLVADDRGDEMMQVPGFLYCQDAKVSAEAFLSYYADDPRLHTPAVLPEIDVPVLVIAGSEDRVVEGLPEAVAPLADGQRISLTVIEGADHFFLDFFAEDAADAIAEFVGAE